KGSRSASKDEAIGQQEIDRDQRVLRCDQHTGALMLCAQVSQRERGLHVLERQRRSVAERRVAAQPNADGTRRNQLKPLCQSRLELAVAIEARQGLKDPWLYDGHPALDIRVRTDLLQRA